MSQIEGHKRQRADLIHCSGAEGLFYSIKLFSVNLLEPPPKDEVQAEFFGATRSLQRFMTLGDVFHLVE
jgi:hypothetical protein